MADSVVDLGAGGGMMSMNEAFGFEPGDPGYVGQFPGRIYKEGEAMSEPYYLSEEYNFEVEDPIRADMYENFAPPLTDQGIRSFDMEGRARPTYPNFEGSFKTAPELYLDKGGEVDVPLAEDGSLEGIDSLRFATPQEVEEGSYRYLQDLQRRYGEHMAAAQSPVTDAAGIPLIQADDNRRYHFEEAARLREQIEDFSSRRASAILNYPESSTKLYVKEGETPYFTGFPDALVQGYENGGEVEEAGILGALFSSDIDLPSSADQSLVRTSAREGSEGAAMYYPAGAPTFEQILEEQYGYPDAERETYGATTSEAMRAARPRHDMPTYQELEDARAHVLQSALLAKQVGPETAETFGGMAEMFDRYMPILGTATDADVVMDKRNNAFGAKLLKEAGINATPQEITQMVDQKIFDQLDVVLGRKEGERRFKSPSTGIDIFFPRDKYGYFDVNRYD